LISPKLLKIEWVETSHTCSLWLSNMMGTGQITLSYLLELCPLTYCAALGQLLLSYWFYRTFQITYITQFTFFLYILPFTKFMNNWHGGMLNHHFVYIWTFLSEFLEAKVNVTSVTHIRIFFTYFLLALQSPCSIHVHLDYGWSAFKACILKWQLYMYQLCGHLFGIMVNL
jgi:hypothetical protein